MAAEASRRLLTDALEVHHPSLPMDFQVHHPAMHHHDPNLSDEHQHLSDAHHHLPDAHQHLSDPHHHHEVHMPSPSKLMPPGYQELLSMGDQLLANAAQRQPPERKKARATPYNARKPAYNKVVEDKDEHGKKRMRKSLMEIKKCSRKEDPETGKIKVNENGAAKRRMLLLKDKVLEVAEMVVGKSAADLVTSDVEMALAFVLERKVYGVSVKHVLGYLPEKHPHSLDAMQKQFQKDVRKDFTNEKMIAGPVTKGGMTKEALAELKKLDTHDVIAATASGIRTLKKGPPKKRRKVAPEDGQQEKGFEAQGGEDEQVEEPPEEVEQGQELEMGGQPGHPEALLHGLVPELNDYEES